MTASLPATPEQLRRTDAELMQRHAHRLIEFMTRATADLTVRGFQAPSLTQIPASSWPPLAPQVVHWVTWFCSRQLLVASDEVRYLANGLVEGVTLAGPAAVGRGAAEASGCAFWLLEPRVGLSDRACRLLGLRLRSARELERTHGGGNLPGFAREYGETQHLVLRDADALGLQVIVRRRLIQVGPVQVPGYTDLADAVLQKAGGIGFYGGWSGSAHGQGWAINQSFMPTVPEGEVGTLNSSRRSIWGTFAGAYSAIAVTFERLCDWNGWPARRREMVTAYLKMRRDYERSR